MANERLYQFPSKATPVPADIIYAGDSASAFNEVNITIAQLISAYPNLSAFGGLTLSANTYAYVNNSSVMVAGSISAFGVSLIAALNAGAAQTVLGLGTAAVEPIAFFLQSASNLSDLASAPTALTNIGAVPIAGGTMTGLLILSANPTNPLGAVTKQYADAIAQGITVQQSCQEGTTANLTATYVNGASGVGATLTNSGAQAALVIDGVTVALNDRILVKNQTTTFQNGIYTVTNQGSGATNWILTRATDYNLASQINQGDLVIVDTGTLNTGTGWLQTANVSTIGTSAITFSPFAGSQTIPNNTILGNVSGTTAQATALTAAQVSSILTKPTVTNIASGASNYTTPANVTWIKVRMVGAGGGSSGSGATSGGAAGAGGNTTFGTSLLVANGGGAGTFAGNGGFGGTGSLGGASGFVVIGGSGSGSGYVGVTTMAVQGGNGGNSFMGGGGGGTGYGGGVANPGAANTGGGAGGCQVAGVANTTTGSGGGAGCYLEAIIFPTALQVFAYSVGAAGTAGAAGSSGQAGAIGGSGFITIEEHYN
jgi:hypothetical protein